VNTPQGDLPTGMTAQPHASGLVRSRTRTSFSNSIFRSMAVTRMNRVEYEA